jgi:cystathionine beta-lyase/cystathionine gamma-synthase
MLLSRAQQRRSLRGPLQRSLVRLFFKDTFYVSTEANQSNGALIPALEFSTTYERDENGNLRDGYYYSRISNPTRKEFEKIVTNLEQGVESFAFSSGMQAATSILLSSPGSYVLLPDDLYHGVMLIHFFSPPLLARTLVS